MLCPLAFPSPGARRGGAAGRGNLCIVSIPSPSLPLLLLPSLLWDSVLLGEPRFPSLGGGLEQACPAPGCRWAALPSFAHLQQCSQLVLIIQATGRISSLSVARRGAGQHPILAMLATRPISASQGRPCCLPAPPVSYVWTKPPAPALGGHETGVGHGVINPNAALTAAKEGYVRPRSWELRADLS